MKVRIISFAVAFVALCAFGLYKWHQYNYVDLITEYYTVETILPCEEDYTYAQQMGVETKTAIQIPRKNEYQSDEEAMKSEQEYANSIRSIYRADAINKMRNVGDRYDFIFRYLKQKSGAIYNVIKISHTRKTDLTELWNIIKEYGLVYNNWRDYCEKNNIPYEFLPLENDGENLVLSYELKIDEYLGKGYNYKSKWLEQGISLFVLIYKNGLPVDKLPDGTIQKIKKSLLSNGASNIETKPIKDEKGRETIAISFNL